MEMSHTNEKIPGLQRLETFSLYNGQPFTENNPDDDLDEDSSILEELLTTLTGILVEQKKTNTYLALMNNIHIEE